MFSPPLADRGSIAVVSNSARLTHTELLNRVQATAARLQAKGFQRRDNVGLAIADDETAFIVALALGWLGCSWFTASRESLSAEAFFYSRVLRDQSGPGSRDPNAVTISGEITAEHLASDEKIALPLAADFAPDDIVMFGQSSGTTGLPKLLPFSSRTLLKRCDPTLLLDNSSCPTVLSLFKPLHAVSFYNSMRTLARGGAVLFTKDNDVLRRGNVSLVIGSPALLSSFVEKHGANLSVKLRRAWAGGGPLSHRLLARTLAQFSEVVYTYGSQEAGNACHRILTEEINESEELHVGTPATGIEIEVVDDAGQKVDCGTLGVIRYRSLSMIDGYVGQNAEDAVHFGGGWFHPGDIGSIDTNGNLHIHGRIAEQLNISGAKLNAAWLDDIALKVKGVADAICFSIFGDDGIERLAVAFTPSNTEGIEEALANLRRSIEHKLGAISKLTLYYLADEIPRNPNGKVMRQEAKDIVSKGVWRSLS